MESLLSSSCVLLAFLSLCHSQTAPPVGTYNVALKSWSVSGISSGACMATQFHVSYSENVTGVGMIAGIPYYCSENSLFNSGDCMDNPSSTDVQHLIQETLTFEADGLIAPVGNMAGDKVYIFHGSADTVVLPGNGPLIEDFYEYFQGEIFTEYSYAAEHGFPTDFYGGPCGALDDEYINNCGYNAAFELLNYIYGGNLTRPTGNEVLQPLQEFDKQEFFLVSDPRYWGVDDIGYLYVPEACAAMEECKLHMVLHGCNQGRDSLGGTSFVENTGYLQVAELNKIIVVFPQIVETLSLPVNAFGCWDWWGYNTRYYATREGGQTLSLFRMLSEISGTPWDKPEK